ncbi:SLC13 family permease [Aeromicrobium sp. IC_218]|uniref:SLC13 family permease n=1 Tax=Aeromicrobium sp. IC_218 TaxID=2545468 RepID=UPI00103F116B|nr:SLC13 family permease [Aeromicrobium sp. IC_218]TCI99633.1 arsenic transporter [Aeromicrobium sp. IC_218]
MLHDLRALAEALGFLVAIAVVARACADAGLFDALGARTRRLARGSASALLALSVVLAALVTAVLSLDATAVLLTPVLLAAAGRRRWPAYATVRLANSASLLLPVSNLTNLLMFSATGLGFAAFAGAMAPVWLVAVAGEYLVLRWWFRDEIGHPPPAHGDPPDVPRYPLAVLVVLLLGLGAGTTPWVVATVAAVLVGVPALVRRVTTWRDLLHAANLPMALLVLAWGMLVTWFSRTPAGSFVGDLLPRGDSWAALVGAALLAMLLAGVVNNLPATLVLLPAAALAGPATVLAVLVGVGVGANLTIVGSLANLLWWRSAAREVATLGTFHRLAVATTPALVVACTTVLWAWTSLVW